MGLITNTSAGAKFANIKDGKISVYRGKDNPPTIHDAIEGYITNIDFKEDEIQGEKYEALTLTIQDGQEAYQLKMRFDSGYGRSLAYKLPNVDLTQKVKLQPNKNTVNDKTQTSFFVEQNGQQIKQKWTKDNPGNLPPLVKTKFKGKDVYDNTDQMLFLKNVLLTLETTHPAIVPNNPNNPVNVVDNHEEESDLPF
jgi:hypothetical protein